MKATFATFDFGYKNLLKIERPTSAKFHFINQKKEQTSQEKDDFLFYLALYINK
jgi:hypothetical protein